MPELNLHTVRTCVSNVLWNKKVHGKSTTYHVLYGRTKGGATLYDWSCSCKAFKFSGGKYCKHITAVMEQKCSWNSELDPGVQADGDRCPDCGGDTEVFQVGV